MKRKSRFLPYAKAKAYVRRLKLKDYYEWREYCQSDKRPVNIPKKPDVVYRDQGWTGHATWLGNGKKDGKKKRFRSFTNARKFARSLGIPNQLEWVKYASSGARPDDIPSSPHQIYKGCGWISLYDWLGTIKR